MDTYVKFASCFDDIKETGVGGEYGGEGGRC